MHILRVLGLKAYAAATTGSFQFLIHKATVVHEWGTWVPSPKAWPCHTPFTQARKSKFCGANPHLIFTSILPLLLCCWCLVPALCDGFVVSALPRTENYDSYLWGSWGNFPQLRCWVSGIKRRCQKRSLGEELLGTRFSLESGNSSQSSDQCSQEKSPPLPSLVCCCEFRELGNLSTGPQGSFTERRGPVAFQNHTDDK